MSVFWVARQPLGVEVWDAVGSHDFISMSAVPLEVRLGVAVVGDVFQVILRQRQAVVLGNAPLAAQ